MVSSSKAIGPKHARRSVAICLVPENNRSHGTDDACDGRTSRAIRASVGYTLACSFEKYNLAAIHVSLAKKLTCHHSTISVSFLTYRCMVARYRRSSEAGPSVASSASKVLRCLSNSVMVLEPSDGLILASAIFKTTDSSVRIL